MKKLTTLMLGLSLVLGTAAFAADDKKPADTASTETKGKKKTKKKAAKKEGDATATPADKK